MSNISNSGKLMAQAEKSALRTRAVRFRANEGWSMTKKPNHGDRRATLTIISFLLFLNAFGCTASTPAARVAEKAAASVKISNDPASANGCALLGEVEGHSRSTPQEMSVGGREEIAHRRIKEAAAKLGADTVVLTFVSSDGSAKRGDAYRCSRPH